MLGISAPQAKKYDLKQRNFPNLAIFHTYQMCESSRIGSFDFVKNSLAAEPEILKQ